MKNYMEFMKKTYNCIFVVAAGNHAINSNVITPANIGITKNSSINDIKNNLTVITVGGTKCKLPKKKVLKIQILNPYIKMFVRLFQIMVLAVFMHKHHYFFL